MKNCLLPIILKKMLAMSHFSCPHYTQSEMCHYCITDYVARPHFATKVNVHYDLKSSDGIILESGKSYEYSGNVLDSAI